MTLERNPVYLQLNALLHRAIAARYQVGDRFLTEREISEQYQVSRATANKALGSLVSEGILEFRRGIGTFVRKETIDYDIRSLMSFTEKALASGKKPHTKVLIFRRAIAEQLTVEIPQGWRIEPDTQVWELERLRFADHVPVIYEKRWIIYSKCPKLSCKQVSGSLYQAWTKSHRLAIEGADNRIRAVILTEDESNLLQVSTGSPALEITAVGFVATNDLLWWERTLYRADCYEFVSRLGPIQTATPARGRIRS
jgi:GntR family transcriptional regulator